MRASTLATSLAFAPVCAHLAACEPPPDPLPTPRDATVTDAVQPEAATPADFPHVDAVTPLVDATVDRAETAPGGDGRWCVSRDLGSALGAAVATGSTPLDSVMGASCGGAEIGEVAFLWTAPSAGAYTLTTEGSNYQTLLYALDARCTGAELACDDGGGDDVAVIHLTARAGQSIVVVVDSRAGSSGDFTLNIFRGDTAPDAGSADAMADPDAARRREDAP